MVRGGFRHLVVVDGSDLVGILSMRDIVRVWCGRGRPVTSRRRQRQALTTLSPRRACLGRPRAARGRAAGPAC